MTLFEYIGATLLSGVVVLLIMLLISYVAWKGSYGYVAKIKEGKDGK